MIAHATVPARPEETRDRSDVNEIKADIERTQAELADTVAQLQRKLTVSHFVEHTKQTAREAVRTWGDTALAVAAILVTQAENAADEARVRLKKNPTPAILVGTGLAAALWHGMRRRRRAANR